MKNVLSLALLATVACTGDDPEEACTNGVPTGMVELTVSGDEQAEGSFDIACGLNTETPWQSVTLAAPAVDGSDAFFEFRFQDGTDWAVSARFAMELEAGTYDALIRTEDDPAPPTGHGFYANPVDTTGYEWDLTSGSITLTGVEEYSLGASTIAALTGTFSLSFAGASDVDVEGEFTDLPVVAP